MQMLKYNLYQLNDKSISFVEFDNVLNRMAEVTTILKQFGTKKEAVDYLIKETNLSIEECSTAYDCYVKICLK